jgi:hypothetical protein
LPIKDQIRFVLTRATSSGFGFFSR